MKKNEFLSGAIILAFGGVLAKIFSAIYRIVLTRVLGGEGIGIYQLIFPIYSLFVILATAGLPMAISKVVAKSNLGKEHIVKKCFKFTSVIALTLSFILIILSRKLAMLQGETNIEICYIILAPTIIFVTASSVLKGYFQGKHNFKPSAISNIIEQFCKLTLGLILSLSLIQFGLLYAIIGAVVGIVVSEIASFVVLLIFYNKNKSINNEHSNVEIKEIIKDVLPITLTNIILPIATFIDSLLVVNLLKVNFTKSVSIFLYGLESGAVASLVGLPTIFSFAIASVILPNLTSSKNIFNSNRNLSLAIKCILIICVPCVICFIISPNRIMDLLYSNKLNGFGVEGSNIAYRLLSISALGVISLAVNQVYSSCLQAVDMRSVTVRNMVIAVVVKFVIEIMFMPSKIINIYALAISNTVCYILVSVLNHFEIKQVFRIEISLEFVAKLIFANCLMVLSLFIVMIFNANAMNSLLAYALAMVVYLVSLMVLKIFDKRDLLMLKYKV